MNYLNLNAAKRDTIQEDYAKIVIFRIKIALNVNTAKETLANYQKEI